MKKIFILFALIFVFNFKQTKAQTWVAMPDTNLVHKLIYVYGLGGSFNTAHTMIDSSAVAVKSIISLNLSNANIASLTGICAFTNLSSLTLNSNNNLLVLNPTIYLRKLKYLEYGNVINGIGLQINSLPSSLTVLKINYISNFNGFTPTLPNLRKLIVDGGLNSGYATSGGAVNYPPSLDTLIFQNNAVSFFHTAHAAHLPVGLKSLSALYEHNLQFFGAVPDSITYFNLPNGTIFGAIPNFPALATYINISGQWTGNNYLGWVTSVPSTIPSGVTYFNISGNQIIGNASSPSSTNTALTYYDISYNSISGVNLYNLNSPINHIDISHNQISSYYFNFFPQSLTYLDVSFNSMSGGFTVPKSLTTFGCSHNYLNSISNLDSTTLYSIDISYNQFYNQFPNLPSTANSLDVSHNQLQIFGNFYNDLRTMCPNLSYFNGGYNQFQYFNLSYFPTSIYTIGLRANAISGSIDLTNQDTYNYPSIVQGAYNNLQYLDFGINQITDITQDINFPVTFTGYNVCPYYCNSSYNTLLLDSNNLTQNSIINLDAGSGNPNSGQYLYFNISKNNLGDSGISNLLNHNLFYKLACQKTNITKLPKKATYCNTLDCSNNPNLICFPAFVHGTNASTIRTLNFTNTGIQCFSNFSSSSSFSSTPSMFTYGMCLPNNMNSCPSFVNINGNLYNDINSNHLFDNTDIRVQNVPIKLYKKSSMTLLQKTFSNYFGEYSFDIKPSDTFVIKVDTSNTPLIFKSPTINDTLQVKITLSDSMDFNKDFSLTCKPNFNDVKLQSVYSGTVIPGQITLCSVEAIDAFNYFQMQNCNVGNLNASVIVVLSGGIKFSSAAPWSYLPSYVSVTLDTIKWINKSLTYSNWNLHFDFNVFTPTTAVLGGNACIQATVIPVGFTDNNLLNNSFNYCSTIRAPFDPNYKDNYPVSQLSAPDNSIIYSVHFQNTGSSPAINVVVKDTLNNVFDPFSIQLLSYSFQPKTIVDASGNLNFSFININLPDSSISQDSSQGFVQFSVKFKNTPSFAYPIKNRASIYFDYNPPILTNQTFNIYCPHPIMNNILIQSCASPFYVFKGDSIRHDTIILDTIKHEFSCDSIFSTRLQFIVPIMNSFYSTICYGSVYYFNNKSYTLSGNYMDTIHSANGCDSIYADLYLTISPLISTSVFDTICSSSSYLFNGHSLHFAGTYNDTFQNYLGCDSVIILHLTVLNISTHSFNQNICNGQSFTFRNQNLSTTGIYHDTIQNYVGCDSIITLFLTVYNPSSSTINQTICNNQTFSFNNNLLNIRGSYYDTIVNYAGCDSIITLNLTVLNTSTHSYSQTTCANQPIIFNNHSLNISGIYFDTLINSAGCDSFLTVNLTVLPISNSSFSQTICANQTYPFNGNNLYNTGIYNDTFHNYLGCDSIVTLYLTVMPISNSSINQTICSYQPYSFNGKSLNATGIYFDSLQNQVGCDSFITLNLIVYDSSSSSFYQTICGNQTFTFNNHQLNSSGIYFDTLTNYLGCDSFISLHLIVLPISSHTLNQTICSNQIFAFNNQNLNTTGVYFDTLQNYLGCDSFITLHLTIINTSVSTTSATICNGSFYTFNGNNYSTAGSYTAHLTNYSGCDSAATLVLTILLNSSSVTTTTICNGQSYTFGGNNYSSSGTYTIHLTNYLGCDSAATLNLTVINLITPTISIVAKSPTTICYGVGVAFKIYTTNAGASPIYNLFINHSFIGSILNDTFNISGLLNGDTVWVNTNVSSVCLTQNLIQSNFIIVHVDSVFTPSVTLTATPSGVIYASTPVTFTATTFNGGISPQFNFKINGVQVQNSSSNTYSSSSLNNGDTISCVLTASNICQTINTATSNLIKMSVNPTGFNTTKNTNEHFSIYPNPTTGSLIISWNSDVIQIQVLDVLGRVVMKHESTKQQIKTHNIQEVNVNHLPNGIYLLKAIDAMGLVQIAKFVKE